MLILCSSSSGSPRAKLERARGSDDEGECDDGAHDAGDIGIAHLDGGVSRSFFLCANRV